MSIRLRFADHRRPYLLQQIFVALLLLVIIGCGGTAATIHPDEAAAVERIRALGGRVELSGDRVIKVYLHETKVADDDLIHISRLTKLQNLFLGKTQISDAGLKHLSGSTELKTLSLNSTAVTDAGLPSLTKLKELKTLNVQETGVTTAGARKLKQSLPAVVVAR